MAKNETVVSIEERRKNFKMSDPVVGILRHVSGTRKANAFFMRKTTANLMERLTNEEQDAMIQIAVAKQMLLGNVGTLSQFRYGEVFAGSVSRDSYPNFVLDLTCRYKKWVETMDIGGSDLLSVCIAICENEHTIYAIARGRRQRWMTVMNMFREALHEWMALSSLTRRTDLLS